MATESILIKSAVINRARYACTIHPPLRYAGLLANDVDLSARSGYLVTLGEKLASHFPVQLFSAASTAVLRTRSDGAHQALLSVLP